MTIHVNSIQRFVFGALPHVLNKRLKAIKPALAHIYSARAVIFESMVGHIVASTFGRPPRCIGSIRSPALRTPVRHRPFSQLIIVETSTASRIPAGKFMPCFRCNLSAIALANPSRSPALGGGANSQVTTQNCKPTIAVASPVYQGAHNHALN